MSRRSRRAPKKPANHPADAPVDSPMLSIVTVFWNHADQLEAFFHGLEEARKSLPFDFELVAVDNASSDGTADAIAKRWDWVRLIRNEQNVLFAPGCNQGLEVARGSHLMLLNPDCEANGDALAEMLRFLRANPSVGAVGCELHHADGLPQQSYHGEPDWRSYWGSHSLLSGLVTDRIKAARERGARRRQKPFRVAWMMGACLMVPREVYECVGPLDADYRMYSEDADWCRRIREAGWAVVHLPTAHMVHHQGSSSRRVPEFAFRRLYRSLLRYTLKHHTGTESFLLRGAVLIDMTLRIPLHAIQFDGKRLASVWWVMKMMATGNIDAEESA